MVFLDAWLLFALLSTVRGQSQSQSLSVITQTDTSVAGPPTDSRATYQSISTTIIQSASSPVSVFGSIISGASTSQSNGTATPTSTVGSFIAITGASRSSTSASGTSTAPAPTNTQPCNNYVEFCNRKYSNITEVATHNSPFIVKNTIFSNQQLDVTTQLNDGVRMLQVQAHFNATTKAINLCHSSCSFLNAGTLESWLTSIVNWLNDNRYEVVTILIGNYGYEDVRKYEEPIRKSGILPHLYVPPKIPMGVEDWPTLGSMILTGKRVVFMMDYQANQSAVPYILDEFIHMWETPFSPTNINFPCTVERPPALPADQARQRMYMANHNLNVKIYIPGLTSESDSPLVPNVAELSKVNGVQGEGSLGLMANNCRSEWTHPPNFLLVDYYNRGSYNGSVFEVAAQMNNVTYNRKCCGNTSGAGEKTKVCLTVTTLAVLYFVLDYLQSI